MSNVFDISDIKIFKPNELDGKTLKISVKQSENIVMIMGRDIETNIIYVLSQQPTK